ncbi:hypothetical protein [Nocardia sp. NPDC057455]|uniref:DUF7426 family protein n=1 Tax=Nocardia sp. NPDC057455 TaxID=3346138 RepID=UPI00366C2D1B
MVELPELRDFFDPSIHLPIGGKVYTIPAAKMDQALRLRHAVVAGMSEATELAEIRELFGPVHDEMLADGVRWTEYLHAGRTALLWMGSNRDIAVAHWKLGQLGELVDLDKLKALVARSQSAAAEAASSTPAAAADSVAAGKTPRKRAAAKRTRARAAKA